MDTGKADGDDDDDDDDRKHSYGSLFMLYTYSFEDMPSTVLCDIEVCTHIWTHLILSETIWARYYYTLLKRGNESPE